MKTRLLILILLTISIMVPVTSFAEQPLKTPEDFQKGTIEWISRCNMIGSDITVMVRDNDMNTDSEKIEQFDVKVWSDFDVESDFENRVISYTVTETGTNTGVFTSKVFLTTTDDSPGKRIRVVDNSAVFAKYVDHTLPNADSIDITDTFVTSKWSVLERNDDGSVSRISYDPCVVENFDKNKDWFDMLDIFYPAPLKQLESGLYSFEVKCKDHLELIFRYHDSTPACVKPESATKLVTRTGWVDNLDAFVYPKSTHMLQPDVHVETDKQEYHTNDVVMISGYVDDRMPDINLTITVYNPLLDVVSVLQVTIFEDGTFTESLPIGGPLWEQNGIYSVSVQYDKATENTEFLYLSDLESDDLL